jgi:hypothetical protein
MIKKRRNFWTKEKCEVIAATFTLRKEFQLKNKNAYNAAKYWGWLDDICKHMKYTILPNNFWTKERCQEQALKCKNRSEFSKLKNGSYYRAMKNGWLDEICLHMNTIKRNKAGFWSKERCSKEALKYKKREEFKLGSNGAYDASKRNGWLNELCDHMFRVGNRYNKFIYGYFFDDGYAYVGLTYNTEIREKKRVYDKKDAINQHKFKTGLIPTYKKLTDLLDVNAAVKMEEYYYEKFKNEGWHMLNRTKTGSIGSGIRKWTFEKCKNEAKKYEKRSDFLKYSSSAYMAAYRYDWLNKIFL